MNRRDLLSECIQPGTPVDVLTSEWCSKCGNPECVRSRFGSSKFEHRIQDWEKKLFLEPPMLAPDDPRFAKIVAQKFITLDIGRTPEVRGEWVDPAAGKEEPVPEAPKLALPPEPAIVVVQAPEPAPIPQKPVGPAQKDNQKSYLNLLGANTPNQPGRMLTGGPKPPTLPQADPWSPPEPPAPEDIVVQPGAKVTLGK
jgi:hypothetical protein